MTEAEWLTANDLVRMWEVVETFPDRKLRLFLCRLHALGGSNDITYIEDFADGLIPKRRPVEHPIEQYFAEQAQLNTWASLEARSDILTHSAMLGQLQYPFTDEVASLARCVFGNPFRPITFLPAWRTPTVLALAQQMYESRTFTAMPILADALQDSGCFDEAILLHCRVPGPHVKGCWCVDALLNKA